MPITPRFTISESWNDTHCIELQIHVPHVRFSVEEIQISLSHHNTTLHFYCPPIYLLVLNFAPYRFRSFDQDGDDDGADIDVVVEHGNGDDTDERRHGEVDTTATKTATTTTTATTTATNIKRQPPPPQQQQQQQQHRATYLPHVQNGMIQLIFEKHVSCQYHWENLDLLGKLQQSPNTVTTTAQDIFAAATTTTTATTTTRSGRSSSISAASKLQWLREIVPDDAVDDVEPNAEEDDDEHKEQIDGHGNPTNMALQQGPTTLPSTSPPHDTITPPHTTMKTTTTCAGTYGFDRMFAHIYDDLQRENSIMTQMLECPWPATTTTTTTTKNHYIHATSTHHHPSKMKIIPIINANDSDADDDQHTLIHSNGVTSRQRQRQRQRKELYENPKFNIERYIQDIDIDECHDFIYDHAITTVPHWRKNKEEEDALSSSPPRTSEHSTNGDPDHPQNCTKSLRQQHNDYFTSNERQLLMSIPYPLLGDGSILRPPPSNEHAMIYRHQWSLGIGLLDLLYAYVYDHLTTIDHEPTVESAWTISTLSISLSWLHDWLDHDENENNDTSNNADRDSLDDMVQSVIQSSIRRSLIYPYIRNFSFSIYIWEQVTSIFQRENCIRVIIRCLLQVRNIINYSDIYYLGNKLYVDPYLIWIQKYSDTNYLQHQLLLPMAQCIRQQISNEASANQLKHSLDLNLLQIEAAFYQNDDGDDDHPVVVEGEKTDDRLNKSDASSSGDEDDDDESDDDVDDDHSTTASSEQALLQDDPVPTNSYDGVDAAVRGIQSLELFPNGADTENQGTSGSRTSAKPSTLDDLLSICTNFETLKTDVNKSATPLIEELD